MVWGMGKSEGAGGQEGGVEDEVYGFYRVMMVGVGSDWELGEGEGFPVTVFTASLLRIRSE